MSSSLPSSTKTISQVQRVCSRTSTTAAHAGAQVARLVVAGDDQRESGAGPDRGARRGRHEKMRRRARTTSATSPSVIAADERQREGPRAHPLGVRQRPRALAVVAPVPGMQVDGPVVHARADAQRAQPRQHLVARRRDVRESSTRQVNRCSAWRVPAAGGRRQVQAAGRPARPRRRLQIGQPALPARRPRPSSWCSPSAAAKSVRLYLKPGSTHLVVHEARRRRSAARRRRSCRAA